jgi:alpha-tubulin suppressor-like RCC1 family protein
MKKQITLLIFIFAIANSFSQCWKSVEASYSYHSIGIQTDGSLLTWGYNGNGQLGDGTTINKQIPTQIGTATNWKSVSNNFSNSFAIKTTGTMWGWGDNSQGQLGIGNVVNKLIPTQIGTATNWDSVSAGFEYTLAIKTNGTLWAWGNNSSGRLGDGTVINKLSPIQIGTANNWVKVVAGTSSFGIKSDGTLWSWGGLNGVDFNGSFVPVQVGTDTWIDISSTYLHAVGLKTNGTICAWGRNNSGALGRGNNANNASNYIATQIGTDTNWKAIAAGTDHSMAVKTNGTLWSWGENDFGQYGNNTLINSFVPLQIGTLTNWRSIVLGLSFSIGFKTTNDRIWTWGRDNQDALGNGSSGDSLIPFAIGTCTTLSNSDFDITTNDFKIYPNPFQDELNIEKNMDSEIQEIQIIDLLGKVILYQNSDFKKINTQNLEKGIYVISIVTNENKNFQFKIIKI